jgi:hypothetical protein
MFGKIRKLYDDSKYLVGSKLKNESDLLYYQAKRRMMLGLKGAIAVGENFVGKIRDDGRADLLEVGQPSGYFGVNCRIPQDPRTAFHYKGKAYSYPPFTYPATTSCGAIGTSNDTGGKKSYPIKSPPMFDGVTISTTIVHQYLVVGDDIDGNQIKKRRIDYSVTLVFDSGGSASGGTAYVESVNGSIHTSDRYQDPFIHVLSNYSGATSYDDNSSDSRTLYLPPEIAPPYYNLKSGTLYSKEESIYNGGDGEVKYNDTTAQTGQVQGKLNPAYEIWLACKENWDSQEDARLLAYSQYLSEKSAYLAEFDGRRIAQLNDGDVIHNGLQIYGYADVYYPDDATPRLPPVISNTVTSDYAVITLGETVLDASGNYSRDIFISGRNLYVGGVFSYYVPSGKITLTKRFDAIKLLHWNDFYFYAVLLEFGFSPLAFDLNKTNLQAPDITILYFEKAILDNVSLVNESGILTTTSGTYRYTGEAVIPDGISQSTLTIPTPAAYAGYENHVIRHRAWRNTKTDLIYADLDAKVMPKNMAIAVMNGAPYSLCVGIGYRWDGYRVTQTSSTVGSGVGAVVTYTRTLFALKEDGSEVELLSGECAVETINTTGFSQFKYTFDNFVALKPIAITSYLNGTYNLTYPEYLPINPSDCNGEPYTVVSINGTYDTLASGVTDSQAQAYSTSKIALVPPPDLTDITFTDIDLTPLSDNDGNIPKDTLRYDIDTDKDGVIESSEKSATSTKFWIGKGLSKDESITLYPIEYVMEDDEGNIIECGMFPQSYDVARLIAIRIYTGYKFNYDGDGGFEFASLFNTPTLDDEGNEITPYTEHPYIATALLGGSNVVVIANSTSFDDVLETRKKQNSSKPEDSTVSIIGQYEKDIDAGKITLKGLYDWCKQQL